MRVLISGATGYLGVHLASAAERRGDEVHAVVRSIASTERLYKAAPSIRVHTIDATYRSVVAAMKAARPEVVYHLASDSRAVCGGSDIATMIAANLTLGSHLCHALSECGGGRMVNAGSYWQYGTGGEYSPNSLYAATKQAFEDIALHYSLNLGVEVVTLVVYDIVGPGDWRTKLIPSLARAMVEGRMTELTGGEQSIDLVHVEDAAKGFLQAGCTQLTSRVVRYALTSGHLRPLRDVVEELCKIAGHPGLVRWGALPYPTHQIFSPTQTIPVLSGWRPARSLSEVLSEIVSEAQNRVRESKPRSA